jgi:hypothetical protein
MDAKERGGVLDEGVEVGWPFFSAGAADVVGFADDSFFSPSPPLVEVEVSLLRKVLSLDYIFHVSRIAPCIEDSTILILPQTFRPLSFPSMTYSPKSDSFHDTANIKEK